MQNADQKHQPHMKMEKDGRKLRSAVLKTGKPVPSLDKWQQMPARRAPGHKIAKTNMASRTNAT